MAFNINLECKKLCIRRCFYALAYSVTAQYFLLTVFLLYVNYSVLHPISWMMTTISTILSGYTWMCALPLIMVVIMYGICLGRVYLAERHYHATRFSRICKTCLDQTLFLVVHVAIGFLTTWLYSRFMHVDYMNFYNKCLENSYCINERYTFLILYGIYMGIYNFVRERVRKDSRITFPVIQQTRYMKIRDNLSRILFDSLREAFLPTLAYIVGCCLLGGVFLSNVAQIFGLHYTGDYHLFDGLLFCYLFVLSAQILSNMRLMDFLFVTLLTECFEFPIENNVQPYEERSEILLVEALAVQHVPIVQELAALDLYTLAHRQPERRQQIFQLSVPGGHPYNWNSLSGQCLSLINAYSAELTKSVAHLVHNSNHQQQFYTKIQFPMKQSATDAANKLLFRQYNENLGIRNIAPDNSSNEVESNSGNDPLSRFTELIHAKVQRIKLAAMQAPGINYLFSEKPCGRVSFLLANGQSMAWTVQGLAALATSSLSEDTYGVVQTNLADIIVALIQLKKVLDKVGSVSFADNVSHNRCVTVQNAVKRSLYRITTVFSDYLPDLLTDANDLRILESYRNYREA